MVKHGFKNILESKANKKTAHSYWQDKQPQYDERSSCYVNCGTEYGVGHRNPVGHHGDPKTFVDTLPQHVRTMPTKPNYNIIEAEG